MSAFVRVPQLLAMTLSASLLASALASAQQPSADIVANARAIHAKVFSVDTHVDINPRNFSDSAPNYATGLPNTQVDLVKLAKGGMSGAFLIVYVGQTPRLDDTSFARANADAMEKFDAIHRLTEKLAPTRAELALTAADARRIHAAGKLAIFIGVENGFPIGSDITNVKKFYDRGGRYMSLAHNGHSQLSDSNTGERDNVWLHHGLSALGKQVVTEMNRLGMMIDVSHPSKESMMQTLQITKAPIIASHSAVRALCNHSRNLDDEQLKALAKNGGVAQIVAFNSYVKCDPAKEAARQGAIDDLRKEFGITATRRDSITAQITALPDARRNAYLAKQEDITARRYPSDPAATVADYVNHIDYAVKMMGVDHVGIASDFDGGGGVDGYRNATEAINITIELVKRGYTEKDIEKIWGGNLLRVMADVEKVGKQLQGTARR